MNGAAVSIVTGWGATLGSGHVQRMACLADYLIRERGTRAIIAAGAAPEFLPAAVQDLFAPEPMPGSACIIRDCRDSTVDEMIRLKAIAPVIAIDDCGPGREHADLAIDLLPNLRYSIYRKDTFIFGYNFADSIRSLGNRRIEKTIDVALYCGMDTPPDTLRLLVSLLPDHATAAVLAGEHSYYIQNGVRSPLDMPLSEALLSAKVLLTHFGITLYEGHAARCRLACINPTSYHADLAERARKDLGILNLGVIGQANPEQARSALASAIRSIPAESIEAAGILRAIDAGLKNFHAAIRPLLG